MNPEITTQDTKISSPSHVFTLVLVMCIGVTLSVMLAYQVRDNVRHHQELDMKYRASDQAATIQVAINRHLDLLQSIVGLYAASDKVDREEFRTFINTSIVNFPAIQKVAWIPRVTVAERQDFVDNARREGLADFRLMELGPGDVKIPAGQRAEYYPIYFAEPLASNKKLLGFDLSSCSVSGPVLPLARDAGTMLTTAAMQGNVMGAEPSVRILMPIYRLGKTPSTIEQRQAQLTGFISAWLQPASLVERALKDVRLDGLDVMLVDESAKLDKRLLYFHSLQTTTMPVSPPTEAEISTGQHVRVPLTIPGRQWSLLFSPTPAFMDNYVLTQMWITLAVGLVITAMFSLYLSAQFRSSTARIRGLAEGLSISNAKLGESEQRFHSITATAQDAIILLDDQKRLVYWNPSAERIFGYTESEALGQRLHQLLVPQRFHDAYDKALSIFSKTGEVPVIGNTLELQALRKDGTEFPIELSLSAVQLGGKWHVVGIVRDISERKAQEDKLNHTKRALSAVHASNILLTHCDDEQRLLDGVCQNVVELTGYPSVWIGMVKVQPGTESIVIPVAYSGDKRAYNEALNKCQLADKKSVCPAAAVIRTHAPYLATNIMRKSEQATVQFGYASVLALPLMQETEAFGALVIYSADTTPFLPEEVDLLKEMADDLAFGIRALRTRDQRRRAEELIAHQAFYDSLTDLPNRAMIMQALDRALGKIRRDGGAVAILFIDLDDFKLVNDTLGHAAGDELLCQASERIKRATRQEDLVARQGGDEFIILLERYGKPLLENELEQESVSVAQRVLVALQEPFLIKDQEAYVSASIGISLLPGDAADSVQLIEHADSAMYKAKNLGRANYQYYSKELSTQQKDKMLIANQLHRAIEQQEFVLYYQPVVELATGNMIGVEALIRWEQEKGKLILPNDFLPVAEDTGLILPISDWVVEEACRQIKEWSDKAISLSVAVNLSVRQMWHGDIATKLMNTIQEAGIPKEMIEFEVTESAMAVDPEKMETVLRNLSKYGIRIALDDFGTGYSSLSRLKVLPINILKIDKSFVDGIPNDADDVAIVTATVKMASSLGLNTLAEGIETAEQWRYLQELGCTRGQGYYFSRPVIASEIEALYQNGHSWSLDKGR